MRVGILAVQGAFIEHAHCMEKLSVEYTLLRNKKDIADDIDRLILPGGESTVQRKLLKDLQMFEPLKSRIQDGVPVLATCAGLILLSENVEGKNGPEESCFGTLPVTTCRNAYGRQLGSFFVQGTLEKAAGRGGAADEARTDMDGWTKLKSDEMIDKTYGKKADKMIKTIFDYPMRFIRAPYIKEVLDENVEIWNVTDGRITAVKYKNQIGVAFHPELTDDLRMHQWFLSL
ncbi:MAG: pyridoxal 5'-phosphate synthase glutaminase subunit PdxT [Clostridiales bacterium]|nr:pyridoxal 5'-phosphate synthase glutaminase subunit PdxT [Clostridiales bacterium]